MKAFRRSRDIAPLILNFGTVVEFALRPFYPRQRTPVPIGSHNRSGRFGEKSLARTWIRIPDLAARSVVDSGPDLLFCQN
jgi:hypothetical protein